jgi:hypothetical protein
MVEIRATIRNGGGMAEVVKHLYSKHKALVLTKTNKQKRWVVLKGCRCDPERWRVKTIPNGNSC